MKTKMIKGTLSSLAAVGLACGAHAQSVGFGLSFGSGGVSSLGFSYAGGNFGVGVGFNTYSPAYYYPYYSYCGPYSWPVYSYSCYAPTWGYWYPAYPSFSFSYCWPTWYSGGYGCGYPYYRWGGYCGWNSGYYYQNSGYYHNNYGGGYYNNNGPHNGGYAYGGNYGGLNHNPPVGGHPVGGGPGYISHGPANGGVAGVGAPGYHRVFSPAYWDQPRQSTPAHNPPNGLTTTRSPGWNQPGATAHGPGYQRIVPTSSILGGNPGTHTVGTYTGHQPGPVAWNGNGNHGTYTRPNPAGSHTTGFSTGTQPAHYSTAWYHPGNPASTVSMNNGSRPHGGRPTGNVNPRGAAFGGSPRPSAPHFQAPGGSGGSRPSGSFAGGAHAPRGGFGGGTPAPHGGFGGGAPASHGGFSGGQMAQGPSMGGGHSFGGGFRH